MKKEDLRGLGLFFCLVGILLMIFIGLINIKVAIFGGFLFILGAIIVNRSSYGE